MIELVSECGCVCLCVTPCNWLGVKRALAMADARIIARKQQVRRRTLHPTLYTLHPTLYTLHSSPTPMSGTCTLNPYTLHSHAPHPALYTLHSTLYAPHPTSPWLTPASSPASSRSNRVPNNTEWIVQEELPWFLKDLN